jgi:hypothetical protein
VATWVCLPLTAVFVAIAIAAIAAHSHKLEMYRDLVESDLSPLQVSMPSLTVCGNGLLVQGGISAATRYRLF